MWLRVLLKNLSDLNKNNRKIEQSFVVPEKKSFNSISFLVRAAGKKNIAQYKFSLYRKDGTLLYETRVENYEPTGTEYYYNINLPQKFGEGSYYFILASRHNRKKDSLKFVYTTLEVVDNNPKGYLTVKDKIEGLKSDLIFNVYEQ